MLTRLQLLALLGAGALLALGGAYWSGWVARGSHETVKAATQRTRTVDQVGRIGKDVQGVDDNGLADRLSHD